MPTRPSPRSERLGTPNTPAIRFTRGMLSRLHWFAFATACQVARPPWTDLTGFPQPPGAFTSRLPTGRSPFPSLDMTTTATGLLCWRDFHPQEWQLVSLHQIPAEQASNSFVLASSMPPKQIQQHVTCGRAQIAPPLTLLKDC